MNFNQGFFLGGLSINKIIGKTTGLDFFVWLEQAETWQKWKLLYIFQQKTNL